MLGWKDGPALNKGWMCFVYSLQLHSRAAGPVLSGSKMNVRFSWVCVLCCGLMGVQFSSLLSNPCPGTLHKPLSCKAVGGCLRRLQIVKSF